MQIDNANKAGFNIQWSVLGLWEWLVKPVESITNFEVRIKSRWIASLMVIFIPMALIVVSIPPIVDGDPILEDIQVRAVIGFCSILVTCYILSKRGYYQHATILALVASTAVIYTVSILDGDADNVVKDATFLIATLMFSSIMLSQRITFFVFFSNILGLLMLPFITRLPIMEEIVKEPLSLMITLYILMILNAHLRNLLENYHIAELKKENAERQIVEEQLRRSLDEKEVLLKEIHHRVKNNLQIVSSMLRLQSTQISDQALHSYFLDSQNRIYSMAMIHEQLYRSDNLIEIDLMEYINDLANYLIKSYGFLAERINLSVKSEVDLCVNIDLAIPCGLIINELISNSMKHAFSESTHGNIMVRLKHETEHIYSMIISDTGSGTHTDLDIQNSSSLGLQLVNALVQQLHGELDITHHKGTQFQIRFPYHAN